MSIWYRFRSILNGIQVENGKNLIGAYCKRRKYSSVPENKAKDSEKTHFGFQEVPKEEKAKKVEDVFKNVAPNYDVMNDVMSGGIHRLWKDTFVERLGPYQGLKVLDMAGGTGDIAFRIAKCLARLPQLNVSTKAPSSQVQAEQKDRVPLSTVQFQRPSETITPSEEVSNDTGREDLSNTDEAHKTTKSWAHLNELSKITVCDINSAMLKVGQDRAHSLRPEESKFLDWMIGDAMDLSKQVMDGSYNAYTISFGMRNVTDVEMALAEAYRILQPGGRFMCLEFSNVENNLLSWLYDLYSFQLIPAMGQVVAGDWHAYQYLVESIRRFPSQAKFADMIKHAGFKCVTYENLSFGVVAIHSGFKF